MGLRFGLGPVFAYEWLMASRRWQMYAVRSLLVLILGLGLWMVWVEESRFAANGIRVSAVVGERYFTSLLGIELTILLLMAPAATAGAICVDKARGTLVHVLATDLSNSEIVLGKLAAKLLPVLGLLLTSAPVLCAALLLGGIAPEAVLGAFIVSLGVGVLGSALALLLSVWGKKMHEVLSVVYLIWLIAMLAEPIANVPRLFMTFTAPGWLAYLNPYTIAWLPYSRRGGVVLDEQAAFALGCLGLSGLCVLVAIARVRAVTLAQWSRGNRPKHVRQSAPNTRIRRKWFNPGLDWNPVLWREWHRSQPSLWVRFVWLAYAVLAIGGLAIVLVAIALEWSGAVPYFVARQLSALTNALQVAVGLLLLCIAAATTLADERSTNTLEVLLSTPLLTRDVVWGKWLGSFRKVPLLAILPAFTALAAGAHGSLHLFKTRGGSTHSFSETLLVAFMTMEDSFLILVSALLVFLYVAAWGAALVSLGLALGTWIARPGRVLAWCIGVYLAVFFGFIFISRAFDARQPAGKYLAFGNPFFAAGQATIDLSQGTSLVRPVTYPTLDVSSYTALALWITIYSGIAVLLYRRTLATFDRYLGRITIKSPASRPDKAPTGAASAGVKDAPHAPRQGQHA